MHEFRLADINTIVSMAYAHVQSVSGMQDVKYFFQVKFINIVLCIGIFLWYNECIFHLNLQNT